MERSFCGLIWHGVDSCSKMMVRGACFLTKGRFDGEVGRGKDPPCGAEMYDVLEEGDVVRNCMAIRTDANGWVVRESDMELCGEMRKKGNCYWEGVGEKRRGGVSVPGLMVYTFTTGSRKVRRGLGGGVLMKKFS